MVRVSSVHETNAQLRHIPALDGIRGIAVLFVVLLHFSAPFAEARTFGALTPLLQNGWVGVEVFFVLSGYLITSILLATRETENYFSAFYARRALRIFPVYILALIGYFGIILPLAHRHSLVTSFRSSEQVWYWSFLGNWRQGLGYNDGAGVAHFWSLAIEEQFYLVFAVLVFWLNRRRLVGVCLGMIALSIGLRLVFAATGHLFPLTSRMTLLHLDPIAMGALLACSPKVRTFCARWAWLLILVGTAGVFAALPANLQITAAGLASSGGVGLACLRAVPLLEARVLRSLGRYSYAMYVVHAFLAGIVANQAKHHKSLIFAICCLAGGTLVSYGLAWLSWNLLEKHVLRLKDRFRYHVLLPKAIEADGLIVAAAGREASA